MKILNLGRIAILASLALVSMQGCAQYDEKKTHREPKPRPVDRGEAAGFTFDKRGMPIPVNADGKPFSSCGTTEKNSCAVFNKKVTIKEFETVTFTKIKYEVNPTCVIYIVEHAGKEYIWFDKNDPNCAELN